MKRHILFCLLWLTACSEAVGAVLSSTNNGIYMAVGGVWLGRRHAIDGAISYDQELVWCPYSNVGYVRIPYSNPNYAFRLKLMGPDGKEVSRTDLGKQYGSRFDQIATDPKERSRRGMGMIEAQGEYDPRDGDQLPGQILPSPDRLFTMTMPGIYTLELEFQISGPHKDTNQPGLELLRFPPIKLKIEKPLAAPFCVFSSTNHGVYISIIGTKTNGLEGFDDDLSWQVCCRQNSMLQSLDLSAGFKMSLLDPESRTVAKTSLGQTIGVNFDAVQTLDALPSKTKLTSLDLRSGFPGFSPAQPFPRLRDCFVLAKPGIYTLEMQIQLFRVIYKSPGQPDPPELLRFPPMTIKVRLQ